MSNTENTKEIKGVEVLDNDELDNVQGAGSTVRSYGSTGLPGTFSKGETTKDLSSGIAAPQPKGMERVFEDE